jgi:hypothetical protein
LTPQSNDYLNVRNFVPIVIPAHFSNRLRISLLPYLRLLAQKLSRKELNHFKSKSTNDPMEITKSAIDPGTDPRVNSHMRAFLRRRLDSAVGFVILACFLTAASSSRAGQPLFITRPPTISPVVTSTQAQGVSADLNQTTMSQIINQLNQSQFQLSATAAAFQAVVGGVLVFLTGILIGSA